MCNYGVFGEVDPIDMVSYVRSGLSSIDRPIDELYVSPSGSLLDPREVPPIALREIYRLVREYPTDRFSFETRVDTLTEDKLEELATVLSDKRIAIGFGLETADPWVMRYCVNKMSSPADFENAAALARGRGLQVYANVALGSALLTEREAVDDAVRTVEWALVKGADLAIVFPMHVKHGTLLEWLHVRGLYSPPSLWSLVEVLRSLEPTLLPRVNISWHRSDYGNDPGVVVSPTTCPACENRVLAALDTYRATPTRAAILELAALDCTCRESWVKGFERTPEASREDRLLANYDAISEGLGMQGWWSQNKLRIRSALLTIPGG